jgi:CRP-like cAMP-binding protein
MKPVRWGAGEIIFNQGAHADCLYILAFGNVRLEEPDQMLQAGDLFGAIELFSDARQRTQTARAMTNIELLRLTEAELAQTCYQNPALAFHLLRLSANRLTSNSRSRSSSSEYSGSRFDDGRPSDVPHFREIRPALTNSACTKSAKRKSQSAEL